MRWIALVIALFATSALAEGPRVFDSGTGRVSLVELYTSEGCSSCPPAESWLNGLRSSDRLWRDIVPVAFHVDYWNNLGWRDRFSDPRFSARQRSYAAAWGNGVVYTPAFVVNGSEWRGGRFPVTSRSSTDDPPGELRAAVAKQRVSVDYAPGTSLPSGHLMAYAALLGFDRTTKVQAGENRGRTLTHDFVVLAFHNARLGRGSDGAFAATIPLPEIGAMPGTLGLAVWVGTAGTPAPIQATGGML